MWACPGDQAASACQVCLSVASLFSPAFVSDLSWGLCVSWACLPQGRSITHPPLPELECRVSAPAPRPPSQVPFQPTGNSEVGGMGEKPGHFPHVVLAWVASPPGSYSLGTGLCGSRRWAPGTLCLSASGRSLLPVPANLQLAPSSLFVFSDWCTPFPVLN